MESNESAEVSPNDRLFALEKAVVLSKFFEKENFNKAISYINMPGQSGKDKFKQMCDELGIDNKNEWLWKALKTAQHEQGNDGGAITGW